MTTDKVKLAFDALLVLGTIVIGLIIAAFWFPITASIAAGVILAACLVLLLIPTIDTAIDFARRPDALAEIKRRFVLAAGGLFLVLAIGAAIVLIPLTIVFFGHIISLITPTEWIIILLIIIVVLLFRILTALRRHH